HRSYFPIEPTQVLPTNEFPYRSRRMVLINQSFHIDSPHHHLLSIYCLYSHLRPALLASVHIISFLAPVSSDFPAIYIYHIPPIRVTLLLCFFHTFGGTTEALCSTPRIRLPARLVFTRPLSTGGILQDVPFTRSVSQSTRRVPHSATANRFALEETPLYDRPLQVCP